MKNILDEIVAWKVTEVETRKQRTSVHELESRPLFSRTPLSMKAFIRRKDKSGIIAEIKRKSPSKGIINDQISVTATATGYESAGASAISVLTDAHFFGGSDNDLMTARASVNVPLLRKDFMVDEYQILEAKSIGADAILLIAATLTPPVIHKFTSFAHQLGLEVLLEVHDENELKANLGSGADMMGVNNRNLKTFELSIDTSRRLVPLIPHSFVKISESGIESPAVIKELRGLGFDGFLMGQNFMQQPDPGAAAAHFMRELNDLDPRK